MRSASAPTRASTRSFGFTWQTSSAKKRLHLGKVTLDGPAALEVVQRTVTNDVSKVGVGEAQYNMVLNERGGIVDDILGIWGDPGVTGKAVDVAQGVLIGVVGTVIGVGGIAFE